MAITITEALAEIKTIGKRIEAKRTFINNFLWRQDGIKDPLDKDGGSASVVAREHQAIEDLEERVVQLRRGIQYANATTMLTIGDKTRSIADWLVWRRDVVPAHQKHLFHLRDRVAQLRHQAPGQGARVLAMSEEARPNDFIVNFEEAALAGDIERLEDVLGQLDGALSMKNATVSIGEV